MSSRPPSCSELAVLILKEPSYVRRCWLEDRYWAKRGVAHTFFCREEYEMLSGRRDPFLARFRRVWRQPTIGALLGLAA